ncbi:MAG: peroxide stress protein YaaA [Frankiaceae bacterium]|nr:peroxide stress protein YaaA [Frankiaceae bacterium]
MLLLLPPSESKATGGTGAPLDLDSLCFPALTGTRRRLVSALERAARRQPDQLAAALGLSARGRPEVAHNAVLSTAPTLPALELYTGVLYEALDHATLRGVARRRATSSLVVASALFGLVRAQDRLPAYRLSGATVLPGVGGLPAVWRPVLEPELARTGSLVVDLRSSAYVALARVPHAVQVRVLRDWGPSKPRTVVSHDNKYTKGHLARALCVHGARSLADVAEVGRTVADLVEVDGRRVDLVLRGLARDRVGRPQTVGPVLG